MKASPLARGGANRLAHIDAVLNSAYRISEAELGNKPDPLDEAIYIILSFQTDLARFKMTWSELRRAYQSWEEVERAPARDLARVLRQGGLQKQKARIIRNLLASVRTLTGKLSLDFLRSMNNEDAERLLTRLPGLSWKGARCVLLYSLGRDVLPVDANTFRILKRTGILSRRSVYRRRTVHDTIQAAIPPARRRALHINLVVHGQRICVPRDPECSRCPLSVDCPKVGLAAGASKRVQISSAARAHAYVGTADGSARIL